MPLRKAKTRQYRIGTDLFQKSEKRSYFVFLQNETLAVRADSWSKPYLFSSAPAVSRIQKGERGQSLRLYVYVIILIRHQQNGKDPEFQHICRARQRPESEYSRETEGISVF